MAAQGNAEERPQSQSQRRAHAEQADAETMMLLWDHIGHDGSGSRADNPDADAGQKPLDEQQRQGIRQKEACYAGRVQQQPGAQDAPAAGKNDRRFPVTKRPTRQPMTMMPAVKPAVLRLTA